MSTFDKLKLFLFTVVFLVLGMYLLTHDEIPTPAFEDLDVVEGFAETRIVTVKLPRGGEFKYCEIKIGDHRLDYLDRFDEERPLGYGVSTGDYLKVWTDLDSKRWTWQIVNGDRTVLEYETVLADSKQENFSGRVVGGCATAIGVIIVLVWLIWSPHSPWNILRNHASPISRRRSGSRTDRRIRVN